MTVQSASGVDYAGFGDLSRFDAVQRQGDRRLPGKDLQEDDGLMIHLTITGRCYAQCKGCVNSAVTLGNDDPRNELITSQDAEPERDAFIIKKLAGRHPDPRGRK